MRETLYTNELNCYPYFTYFKRIICPGTSCIKMPFGIIISPCIVCRWGHFFFWWQRLQACNVGPGWSLWSQQLERHVTSSATNTSYSCCYYYLRGVSRSCPPSLIFIHWYLDRLPLHCRLFGRLEFLYYVHCCLYNLHQELQYSFDEGTKPGLVQQDHQTSNHDKPFTHVGKDYRDANTWNEQYPVCRCI